MWFETLALVLAWPVTFAIGFIIGYLVARPRTPSLPPIWRDPPNEPIGWSPDEIEEINANRAR